MQARTDPVAAEQANSMNAADRTHFPLGCQAMPGLLFRCRRGLAQALGTGQTLHKSKRFAAAFLILTVSFSIKSLHAVDLSRVMHTTHQAAGPRTGLFDLSSRDIFLVRPQLLPCATDSESDQFDFRGFDLPYRRSA